MTRRPPRGPDADLPAASDLHALYDAAANEEPDAALDRTILAAAHAELRGAAGNRRASAWKRWLPATSAIAVGVIGVSVALRLGDEGEPASSRENAAPQASSDAQRPTDASKVAPDKSAVAPVRPRTEGRIEAPASARREAAPAQSLPAAPAAPVPAAPPVAAKMTPGSLGNRLERHDAAARAPAASGVAAPAEQKAESANAPPAREDAATPDAGLKRVRELRDAGRIVEARQSLSRLRERYPQLVVPDDLKSLQ